MKKRILIFITFSIISFSLVAQNKITYDFSDNCLKKVTFYNEDTLNIDNNNPYFYLDFPIGYTRTNLRSYKLSGISSDNLLDKLPDFHISDNYNGEITWNYLETYPAITSMKSDHHFAVSYFLIGYGNQGRALGCMSSFFVFDSLGNKIMERTDIPFDISRIHITDNSKYLGIQFGIVHEESLIPIIDPGFRVYDIEKDSVIDHVIIPENTRGIGIAKYNNVLSYLFEDFSNEVSFMYFYHSITKKKYSIELSYADFNELIDINDTGLFFKGEKEDMRFSDISDWEDLK